MIVPWDAATGAAIGADWLLAAIAPAGEFGRRVRAAESAFRRGDEVAAAAALERVVTIARDVPAERLAALAAALAAAPDVSAAAARAAGGGILSDVDLFELLRFFDSLGEIGALARYPLLAAAAPRLPAAALVAALEPGRTKTRSFYLADDFSAELATARGHSTGAQTAFELARGRIAARVARYAGLEHVRDGEFVLMRDRLGEPLLPEIRVVREAPTYLLCELALDDAGLAASAEREHAATRVAEEEEAVRARLSSVVALAAPELEEAGRRLGELDVLVARARFAGRYACVLPEIARDAAVAFADARYLPLADALGERERAYVPLSLELAGLGIVTGPNMGGKTAALRTLGFTVACVALGVPVPAAAARVPLVDDVAWLGLGAFPPDDALLSAFGREIVELRSFLERRSARALVLGDEFARTTSPREGRALLVALIETLRERGAFGLVATHLGGVAARAALPHYAVGGVREVSASPPSLDLGVALERLARATDYRLQRVPEEAAPQAGALALAEALGLDADLIARARAAL